jgi:hypothetical protein
MEKPTNPKPPSFIAKGKSRIKNYVKKFDYTWGKAFKK